MARTDRSLYDRTGSLRAPPIFEGSLSLTGLVHAFAWKNSAILSTVLRTTNVRAGWRPLTASAGPLSLEFIDSPEAILLRTGTPVRNCCRFSSNNYRHLLGWTS